MRNKRLLIAAATVLVGLAALALCIDQEMFIATLPSGKTATDVREVVISPGVVYSAKFSDLSGNGQALGQWDQKLLVVNFWATWCGPCKEEIPILVKLQAKFGERSVQFVGIAADSAPNVANFVKSESINYPILIGETSAIEFSKRLGNRLGLLPHTVVIKPGGDVIYTKLGLISEHELIDIIVKNSSISH